MSVIPTEDQFLQMGKTLPKDLEPTFSQVEQDHLLTVLKAFQPKPDTQYIVIDSYVEKT